MTRWIVTTTHAAKTRIRRNQAQRAFNSGCAPRIEGLLDEQI
jgi:hypothetical protein